MKNKLNILIIKILLFNYTYSQVNLVPNSSFESYSMCPSSSGEIYKAIGWDSYNGSVDYYNACATNSFLLVPKNTYGYQSAYDGNAYAGLITYWDGGLAREILGCQLLMPLTISQKYYMSFKISRADTSYLAGYSSNKIGVKFSSLALTTVSINNIAHFYSNVVITDTINWTKIFGSFVPDSAYQNIMIGNFFDDANTTITNQASGIYAYYFIDDMCLSTDSAFCQNYVTSIKENTQNHTCKICPNPSNDYIIIEQVNGIPIEIFNSLGQKITYDSETKHNTLLINCSDWSFGLYYIKIKNINHKIIIKH